ncbi:MAG: nuclear transport factor 2 family protein [Gammaproteobacteria bacterium]|nr:nuclear transport factor 2 family protein [Gammaproteobacteria bacterium]
MIRLLIASLAMFCSAAAQAGAHDDFSKVPEQYDKALSAELQDWLNGYAEVYNRQDYDALLRMWDQDFVGAIYTAEEVDPPLHGWDRINRYFNPIPGFSVLDGIRNEYSDVRASYLAPDLAVATYRLRFDIKVKRQEPMSSWDRILAVFRKKDDGWKLVAYAEAPMAPLTMVRKMLENAVPEDFDAYIESQRPAE